VVETRGGNESIVTKPNTDGGERPKRRRRRRRPKGPREES
jgi:hypothetical protein